MSSSGQAPGQLRVREVRVGKDFIVDFKEDFEMDTKWANGVHYRGNMREYFKESKVF